MDIQINLDPTSDEARQASELARELVVARVLGRRGPDRTELFDAALLRVVTDLLGDVPLEDETAPTRLAYLLAGFSTVAHWLVLSGVDPNDPDSREGHKDTVLRAMGEALSEGPPWF